MAPLLEVRNLAVHFTTLNGTVRAVNSVDFTLNRGETLGIVGESGCGKSVTALTILQLIPSPPARIVSGEIMFNSESLLKASKDRLRAIRGRQVSMIFQEPMTSLNPVFTIGHQIGETFRTHQQLGRRDAIAAAIEMLQRVQLPSPEKRIREYPHQLSGGMRQRVMIAMALACKPEILIADEPTTALDVTIQAQILDLMLTLKQDLGTAILMITHDLGVIAETAQRVVVFYAGKIVETAPVDALFAAARHPYTLGLLKSVPRLGQRSVRGKRRLQEIPGVVPDMIRRRPGCLFAPRCNRALDICTQTAPELKTIAAGHSVSCWRVDK